MASLSSHNPASSTLVAGSTDATSQGRADLAHFTFSGNGTVTNLKLKRIGVSADTTLENVYLYDGEKRLTDAASVTNSEITFNDAGGLFMVSGSKNISVRADIDASTAGQTVGVQLSSFNGNAVSLSANLHTIASATLADLTLASSVTPSTNSALTENEEARAGRPMGPPAKYEGHDIHIPSHKAVLGAEFVAPAATARRNARSASAAGGDN
jgi:hypothetical protein